MLQVAHAAICGVSCSSNLFLLYLIICHTPIHLKLCFYELITSSSSFIIFPRIVPLGFEGIICVYEGPCVEFENDYICFLIYILVLHGFIMFNIQMTANFCFRFYILWRQNPGVKRLIMVNCMLLMPTLFCVWCFLQALAPDAQVRKLILKTNPQYDFSRNRLIGTVDLPISWALPSILLIVCTALPCTLVNVIAGRAVSRFLRDHAARFSSRVLTLQTAVSQSFLIAVSCYVLGQLDIVHSPFQEYATHMIGDCCIVCSPLLTMYFVRPYRRQIERMFGIRDEKVRSRSQWTENRKEEISEMSFSKIDPGQNLRP